MPINNESRVIFEFTYEFPFSESEGEGLVFPLRFHHTEELGDTITFLDKDGKPTDFHLPAQMFAEVAEYLIAKGAIHGRLGSRQSTAMPVVVSGGTRLGLPVINRNSSRTVAGPSNSRMQQIRQSATHVEIEASEGDDSPAQDTQTFIPSGVTEGLESVADVEPLQSFDPAGVTDAGEEEEPKPAPASKPAQKPRLAAREKLSVSDIRSARANSNPASRIRPTG